MSVVTYHNMLDAATLLVDPKDFADDQEAMEVALSLPESVLWDDDLEGGAVA